MLKMAGESPVVFPGHRMILVLVETIMTLVWNTETALAEQVQPGHETASPLLLEVVLFLAH